MTKYLKFFIVIFIVTLFVSLSNTGSVFAETNQDLFIDTHIKGNLDRSDDPTIVRARFVSINFDLLPASADSGGGAGKVNSLDLNLFGGVFFRAVLDRMETNRQGSISWIGHIEGTENGQVILAYRYNDQLISGNISMPGAFYQVRFAGNGVHAVYQLDHSKFSPCAEPDAAPVHAHSHDTPHTALDAPADDGSSIDVMVVYNQAARAGSGGTAAINTEIGLAITETNQGYINSGINQRVNLVHTAEVAYIESGSIYTDRNRLRDQTDTYMDEVHVLRDAYGADLVVLITEGGGGYCGVAYIMTTVSPTFESYGFCVVKRSCATGYYSFGHELGHLMSARHDWYVDPTNNSPYTYNHAYVNVTDQWRTVMAYNSNCSVSGSSCTRLDYWSNPDVTYGGDPMGVPEGSPNAADNRKTLNNTAFTVANFRQHGTTPAIGIIAPNGGEGLVEGRPNTIKWLSYGTVGSVKIELSINNGGSWSTITSSTANDGEHPWTVPYTVSSQCLVRISEASDGSPSDTSDSVFSIVPASTPTITVTSPNGGESLEVDSVHTITWTDTGTVGDVRIEYTANNGSSWTTLASATDNDGVWDWLIPDAVSSQCRVRISEMPDGSPTDTSDSLFSIIPALPPSITVTSPNGGETLLVGATHTITWTTTGPMMSDMEIEYSTNNGSSWSMITSSAANTGSYPWLVPSVLSSQCRVKITGRDTSGRIHSDTSNSVFTIAPPSITVNSPNGSENWAVGSSQVIYWDITGAIDRVKIEYSINNGISWSFITNSISANLGSIGLAWTIPNIPSSQCLVKISEVYTGSPTDTSDALFSIVSASTPTITVTSPNGGESLEAGSNHTITWTTSGTVGNVKIEYSSNSGSTWYTIKSSTSNDGVYSWTLPAIDSSQCRVRISEASDGSPSDTSNSVFSIFSPALTVTSPNGGEKLEIGTGHTITWTDSGAVGNVTIEYSTDSGGSWSKITSSTANDGVYKWPVPGVESSQCLVKISEASDGSPADTSDAVFTIYSPTPPEIALNRIHLDFGATTTGTVTGSQTVLIENSGGGTLEWTTFSSASWLSSTPASGMGIGVISVSVNPAGQAVGTHTGTITITDPDASNSPRVVTVTLKVYNAGTTANPFGEFSTPIHGSTVSSSIPVTGWVADDVDVISVKIFNGSNYVGDAVFVEGARPDVENAYPGYPKNYQAGWGYMMLTNFLPNGGNGTYTFYAKATDAEGHQVTLGSKTVTINNSDAVEPFGAIDAPTQGGVASGSSFVNWGWVLTPQPNSIPTDGSTIDVFVDGVKLGHPTYNNYRADIATLFPGYANSNGAVGYFHLDTTAYGNGIHTIYWTAADDAGNTDGIGSRYFTIWNTGGDQQSSVDSGQWTVDSKRFLQIPVDYSEPVEMVKGYGKSSVQQTIFPDDNGMITIKTRELQRVKIQVGEPVEGYLVAGGRLNRLPIGSTLDSKQGIFYWIPGPGFSGKYEFVFIDGVKSRLKRIIINIRPKYPLSE